MYIYYMYVMYTYSIIIKKLKQAQLLRLFCVVGCKIFLVNSYEITFGVTMQLFVSGLKEERIIIYMYVVYMYMYVC